MDYEGDVENVEIPVGVCIPDPYFETSGAIQALCKDDTANSDVLVRVFSESDCSGDGVEGKKFASNQDVVPVVVSSIVGGKCDKAACDVFLEATSEDCNKPPTASDAKADFIKGNCGAEKGSSYASKSCTNSTLISEMFSNEQCSGTGTPLDPRVSMVCDGGKMRFVDCEPNLPTGPGWPTSGTASPTSSTASPTSDTASGAKLRGMHLGLMIVFIVSLFML